MLDRVDEDELQRGDGTAVAAMGKLKQALDALRGEVLQLKSATGGGGRGAGTQSSSAGRSQNVRCEAFADLCQLQSKAMFEILIPRACASDSARQ